MRLSIFKLAFNIGLISFMILLFSGFGRLSSYFCAKVDCAYQVYEEFKLGN